MPEPMAIQDTIPKFFYPGREFTRTERQTGVFPVQIAMPDLRSSLPCSMAISGQNMVARLQSSHSAFMRFCFPSFVRHRPPMTSTTAKNARKIRLPFASSRSCLHAGSSPPRLRPTASRVIGAMPTDLRPQDSEASPRNTCRLGPVPCS